MLLPYLSDKGLEVGVDEAGRGSMVGPVYAAAVIWPKDLLVSELKDSKLLSAKKRNELRTYIEKNAIAMSVASVEVDEIEEINILQAAIKAMHKALDDLKVEFQRILVDGNKFNDYKNIEHHTIIKGDNKYMSIAAASILAKTYRDEYMIDIHNRYPEYDWINNKGYGTKKHRATIQDMGLTPYHRKSFCSKYIVE